MLGLTGKYRLDRRLGGGGMAEVFIGSTVGAEGFSRKVAIKRVLPGYSENEQFAQMFVAEAQLSSRLEHPNIVSVLDFDRDADGRLFLVMELVDGRDLDALVRTGLLPFAVVIQVIADVLRGLGYAHQPPGAATPGLIHRDVSPHNVLLSWEGAVKVSDFGIAKARTASNATASVFIKGKPAYMSPEQANGSPLDGRSDLFAVGIMLWELLVGRRLFVAEDTRGTLARVLFAPIPSPRDHRAEVPEDLAAVAMRLLDRDLDARYPTCEDALDDLMACADAPRAGRDELIAVMAARFPTEAPARPRRNSLPGGGVRAPLAGTGSQPATRSPAVGVPVYVPTAGAPTGAPTGPLIAAPSEPVPALPVPISPVPPMITPVLPMPALTPVAPTMRPSEAREVAVAMAPTVQRDVAPAPQTTIAGIAAAADHLTPVQAPPRAATTPAAGAPVPPMAGSASPTTAALRAAPTRTMAPVEPVAAPPPIAAVSSVGAMPAAPRRRVGLYVGGVLVALAAAGVAIYVTTRPSTRPAAPATAMASGVEVAVPPAPPTTGSASVAVVVAPPDAAPAPPDAAARPRPDAAPASSPPSSAGSAAAASAVDDAVHSGKIVVSVDPWAMVSLDGGSAKQTPFTARVSPGKHTLKLTNEDLGKAERVSVTVVSGKTSTIDRTWR